MNQTVPASSGPSGRRRWYRRPWLMGRLGVLGTLVLAIAAFAQFDLEISVGSIKANDQVNSSSTILSGSDKGVVLRRVLVMNLSDGPMMQRVAQLVRERLAALPMVDKVDMVNVVGDEDWPNAGGLLYDFYLTLDLSKFDPHGMVLTGRTLDATLVASGGQSPWGSTHGVSDSLDPPLVRINFTTTLEHHSVTTGYESSKARYKMAAENMAKQLTESLTKQITDWSSKYGLVPDMPAGLWPEYRDVPTDLPLPDEPGIVRILSGHGLMIHNHTMWTLQANRPLEILTSLHDQLLKAGWRSDEAELGEKDRPNQFRATRNQRGQVYEAYEERGWGVGRPSSQPVRVVIEFHDRMTRQEMSPAIEQLLAADDTPIQTLMMFSHNMESDEYGRLMEKWMTAENLSGDAQLMLARYLHRKGRDEEAMKRLRRAYLMAKVCGETNTSDIEKLAKEIMGDKKWKPPQPRGEELADMGIKPMAVGETVTTEVGLDEPAMYYQFVHADQYGSDKLQFVTATIERASIPEGVFTLDLRYSGFDGGGGYTGDTPQGDLSPWQAAVGLGYDRLLWYAAAEETSPRRFRIQLRTTSTK